MLLNTRTLFSMTAKYACIVTFIERRRCKRNWNFNINTRLYYGIYILLLKATIEEHSGYEFKNPIPDSMREVFFGQLIY